MKNILLPTDFSKCSRNAAKYAVKLFGVKDVKYTLVNTYIDPPTGAGTMVSIIDVIREQAEKGIQDEASILISELNESELQLEASAKYGDLSYVISKLAKECDMDYVVMGTKGATGFMKFLSGSNASNVIRDVESPLLIIPDGVEFNDMDRIGLSTNFKDLENLEVLNPLRDLAFANKSEVRVITIQSEGVLVDNENNKTRASLEMYLEGVPKVFYKVEHEDAAKGIYEFVDNYELDLLVMVTKHYGFFEGMFHSSMTKKLAMMTNAPLLILYNE